MGNATILHWPVDSHTQKMSVSVSQTYRMYLRKLLPLLIWLTLQVQKEKAQCNPDKSTSALLWIVDKQSKQPAVPSAMYINMRQTLNMQCANIRYRGFFNLKKGGQIMHMWLGVYMECIGKDRRVASSTKCLTHEELNWPVKHMIKVPMPTSHLGLMGLHWLCCWKESSRSSNAPPLCIGWKHPQPPFENHRRSLN